MFQNGNYPAEWLRRVPNIAVLPLPTCQAFSQGNSSTVLDQPRAGIVANCMKSHVIIIGVLKVVDSVRRTSVPKLPHAIDLGTAWMER